jgi:hypothetical protein
VILNNYHVPDEHLEWLEEECAITARLIAIGEIKVNDTNLLTQDRINANLLGKAKAEGWPKQRRKHGTYKPNGDLGKVESVEGESRPGFEWDDSRRAYVNGREAGKT